ncbi:ribonuclease Z [Bacteroidales bacterium OttesenSCG-928-K03]|nr:ribonuclease Z [Bacteroidales bacterium OttesenSCG-928-K03]
MSIKITIIGSNSAIPSTHRWTSAQFLNVGGNGVLLDCGEGTQIRLKMFGIKLNAINQIYITHLHGDHFFGLIGLISTFHLMGRNKPLTIFGPKGLKEIINFQLEASNSFLCYELNFIETNPNEPEIIFEDKDYSVTSFPLRHSVDTTGFMFKEKEKLPNVKRDFIIKHDLSVEQITEIKNGNDFIDNNGNVYKHNKITYSKLPASSYAYCTDTMYLPEIVPIIKDVDLIYHEATFLSDLQHQAIEKFHATAKEAAMIARDANAKKLIIGHFSKRYKTTDVLVAEAVEIFPNTIAAEDGMRIEN